MNLTGCSSWPLLATKLSGSLPKPSATLALIDGSAALGLAFSLRAATKMMPANVATRQTIPMTSTTRLMRDTKGMGEIIFIRDELTYGEKFDNPGAAKRCYFPF